MFKKITIRTKLLIGFIFLSLIAGAIGLIGITDIKTMQDADTRLYEKMTIPTGIVAEIAGKYHRIRCDLRDVLLIENKIIAEDNVKSIENKKQEIIKLLSTYETTFINDEDKKNFQNFKSAYEKDIIQMNFVLDEIKAGNKLGAVSILYGQMAMEANKFCVQKLDTLLLYNIISAKETAQQNTSTAGFATTKMLILIIIGLFIAIGLGFIIASNIKKIINMIINETARIIEATLNGNLKERGKPEIINSEFRELVIGINRILDAVTIPLNVAAEYVDRIAKGNIPMKITEIYNGDFNQIKNNINLLIDSINNVTLISENIAMGKLENEIILRSTDDKLMIAFQTMTDVINNLVKDINSLSQSAIEGNLEKRADSSKQSGDFKVILDGVNKTLENILEPINEAGQVLAIMSTGNLTARMKGEYMGDNQKLKNSINSLGDSLTEVITQVNENVHTTANSAFEISSSAESLATASQEQSAHSDEVASAVEEMSRTVAENAESANRTADVARKSGDIATIGADVVKQTINKMKDIAEVVKTSAANIQKLGDSSKEIGEIISVIDDIADQTNLLALNAAIEAARAGEQGRGFAVVADEVRKLAERTTDATKQIAKMINGIQNDTSAAVIAMNKGTNEVMDGIELADKAGLSLNNILSSTMDVLDMINQIAAANEQQSATSEQIAKNVMSISKVTGDSAKKIEDVARSSDELAKLTEQLKNLINRFIVKNDDLYTYNPMKQLIKKEKKLISVLNP